jgi:hypothetical protein
VTPSRKLRSATPRRAAFGRLGAALSFLLAASVCAAAPHVPASDETVIERLPDPRTPELRELAALRAKSAAAPDSAEAALAFARRALELGQRDGDARLVGRADAALAPLLASDSPPASALVLHATVQQNRHEFAAASSTLRAALERNPRDAQAWFTRAAIELVQGDPRASLASCGRLYAARIDALWIAACAGAARSRLGQARASYESLGAELARAQPSAAQRRWLELTLGEIAARLGEAAAAEAHDRAALALEPADAVARGELADLLLDLGRPAEVRELLRGETRSDPLILRLALAEHRLGRAGEAESHAALLEARAAEARLRGASVHAREEARLALELRGDPRRALELAMLDFSQQREPADARILLEAALAAGDRAAAAPALAWLDATGLEDARLTALVAAARGVTP